MLRASGARMKRRNVWNSLFWSLPSKVCWQGRHVPSLSPYLSACHLMVPLAVSLLHLSWAPCISLLCCYLSVSLFPMSFQQFSTLVFLSPPSPSITYSRSTSMYLPISGSPWQHPCLFSHCWAHVQQHMEDRGYIFNTFCPTSLIVLPSFHSHILKSLIPLFHSTYFSTNMCWDPLREQALD